MKTKQPLGLFLAFTVFNYFSATVLVSIDIHYIHMHMYTFFTLLSRSAVPKLGAAKTCERCCIYCFPHKNYNVKLVNSFLQFYSV